MSTEKVIKKQAKELLNGNWSIIICAVIFVCIIPIIFDNTANLAASSAGLFDNNGYLKPSMTSAYNIIYSVSMILMFLLSPFINGIVKMFCNTALYGKTVITDLFFYYRNISLYLYTCIFNAIVLLVSFVLGYGLDFYNYAVLITGETLDAKSEFSLNTIILIVCMLLSFIVKVIIYMIFVHYPLIAYSTFDNIPISKCLLSMYAFSLRHFFKTLRLAFSFIGWILLCFFVVPAFYVLPYAMTSACVSAKWLFSLDKDRGLLC